ncbi:hypothetical protein D3C71_2005340 [compost metagenome]
MNGEHVGKDFAVLALALPGHLFRHRHGIDERAAFAKLLQIQVSHDQAVFLIQAEPPERWIVAAVVTVVFAAKSNGKSET